VGGPLALFARPPAAGQAPARARAGGGLRLDEESWCPPGRIALAAVPWLQGLAAAASGASAGVPGAPARRAGRGRAGGLPRREA
ncbi:unnamed protein product, partial [Prorocentrum cordatum]